MSGSFEILNVIASFYHTIKYAGRVRDIENVVPCKCICLFVSTIFIEGAYLT